MPTTVTQLELIREWIGLAPDDGEVDDIFDRHGGSVTRTIREILRDRHAEMLRNPASISISGEISLNYAENIKALERQLAALDAEVGIAPPENPLSKMTTDVMKRVNSPGR